MKPWTEARNNNKYMKYHSKLTYQLSFWNVSQKVNYQAGGRYWYWSSLVQIISKTLILIWVIQPLYSRMLLSYLIYILFFVLNNWLVISEDIFKEGFCVNLVQILNKYISECNVKYNKSPCIIYGSSQFFRNIELKWNVPQIEVLSAMN